MKPEDLVYKETLKRCLDAGVDEIISKNAADECLLKYKRNQFSKPSKLIDESVSTAKRVMKTKKKKKDKK